MFGFPWDDTNCMVSWDGTDFFVNDGVFTVSNGFVSPLETGNHGFYSFALNQRSSGPTQGSGTP